MSKNISLLKKAIKLHSQGKISDAKKYYERILKEDSSLPDCYNNLGVIYKDNYKDLAQAESLFKKAISLRPDNNDYLKNYALTLLDRGDFNQASTCFLNLHSKMPNNLEIVLNYLISVISNNHLDTALTFIQGLKNLPIHEEAIWSLFIAFAPPYSKHAIIDEALGFFSMFFSKNNTKSSKEILNGIAIPNHGDCILLNLVPRLLEYDFYDENLEFIFELIEKIDCTSNIDKKYFYLGFGQSRLGNYKSAVDFYKKALKVNPSNSSILPHLAQSLMWAGFTEEALKLNERHNLKTPLTVVQCLNDRKFKEAWELYMSSEQHKHRKAPLPSFSNEGTNKNVLVYRDQGIGDEIMFYSCLQDILAQDLSVYVECSPRLHSILERSFPSVKEFIPVDPLDKNIKKFSYIKNYSFDSAVRTSRLPQLYRNTFDSFPKCKGYLSADPDLKLFWQERLANLGNGLKVGIAWKGGINFKRGIKQQDISALDPLLNIKGIQWVNLQYGDITFEKDYFKDHHDIELLSWTDTDITNDFNNLAALLEELDLVIQINNTSLHLAGALGVECWGLLMHESFDMRWFEGETPEHTPWYPSVNLFRQGDQESIHDLLLRVSQSLLKRINEND